MSLSGPPPEAGQKGWIPFPQTVCTYFRKGTCLRVGCKMYHGTEQVRADLQARGVTLYRVNDGSVYPPLSSLPAVAPTANSSTSNLRTDSPPLPLLQDWKSAASDRSSANSGVATLDDLQAEDETSELGHGGRGPLTPTHSPSSQLMFSLHQPTLLTETSAPFSPDGGDKSFSRRSEQAAKGIELSATHQEIANVIQHGNPLSDPNADNNEPSAVVACLSFISGTCRRGDCKYVHLRPEIRLLPTSVCAYYDTPEGCCKGDTCRYFHGPSVALKAMQEKGIVMYNPKTNVAYDEIPKDLEDKDVRVALRKASTSRQSLNTAHLTTSPGSSHMLLGHAVSTSLKSLPIVAPAQHIVIAPPTSNPASPAHTAVPQQQQQQQAYIQAAAQWQHAPQQTPQGAVSYVWQQPPTSSSPHATWSVMPQDAVVVGGPQHFAGAQPPSPVQQQQTITYLPAGHQQAQHQQQQYVPQFQRVVAPQAQPQHQPQYTQFVHHAQPQVAAYPQQYYQQYSVQQPQQLTSYPYPNQQPTAYQHQQHHVQYQQQPHFLHIPTHQHGGGVGGGYEQPTQWGDATAAGQQQQQQQQVFFVASPHNYSS